MRFFSPKGCVAALAAIALGLTAQPSKAAFTFQAIPGNVNNTTDSNNAIAQLQFIVTDAGPGKATFEFRNTGNVLLTLTDIWFDDGSLIGIVQPNGIQNGPNVLFTQGAVPTSPPGSHSNTNGPFDPTKFYWNTTDPGGTFSSDSETDRANGIDPGEWLKITFDLKDNTFNHLSVINALNASLAAPGNADNLEDIPGGLRVAIHVQGFANEGSETLVNSGTDGGGGGSFNTVPAPAGIVLLASALPVVALRRLIRRKPAAA